VFGADIIMSQAKSLGVSQLESLLRTLCEIVDVVV
jgi:hypothetical protein